MNELTVGDVISSLKDYREYLEKKAADFKQEIQDHWQESRHLQTQFLIETKENNEISFSIPALNFRCVSTCRIVFLEKLPVAEVRFSSEVDEKTLDIETYYLDTHGHLHVGLPGTNKPIDFEFESIGAIFLGSIVKSASANKLISL
ncbi:hypothetical protein I5503_03040 [Citrobacter amalonaticus]|uniref:hypothetical protein n=1 Tax=Citrobacter amalonaticus TaxID=35703 RepID=UPI001903E9ED|nr:hypothetical protein [Citrobacter amalonaticus]MBJ9325806.1 hypothetical protein [Citrobacter amalonaticus]